MADRSVAQEQVARGASGLLDHELSSPASGRELRQFHIEKQRGSWPINEKVGDTPLVRLRELAGEFGLKSLFAKLEGRNTTSTHKDRIAVAHVNEAIRLGYTEIVTASCGDYAEALGWAAAKAGLKCKLFIPEGNPQTQIVINHLNHNCRPGLITFVQTPGCEYGDAWEASQLYVRARRSNKVYDANAGSRNNVYPTSGFDPYKLKENDPRIVINQKIEIDAYAKIAQEIVDQLGEVKPTVVLVPAGNGTTIVGLREGFKRLGLNPRLIACTDQNPMLKAFRDQSRRCTPLGCSITVDRFNEAVAGAIALDGDPALQAIHDSFGRVVPVDSRFIEMGEKRLEQALREEWHPRGRHVEERVDLLPISGATLGALYQHPTMAREIYADNLWLGNKREVYVLLLTGEVD